MGYIKEPYGIDFTVDPRPLTEEEKKMISEVIAYYKSTGRKKSVVNNTRHSNRKKALVSGSTHK